MKIIICDDDLEFIDNLSEKIKEISQRHNLELNLASYSDPLVMINEVEFDRSVVFFLDIEMPKMSGFDVASNLRRINRNTPVVFVSNKDELVYRVFDYQPLYFIRKNYLDEELEAVLIKLDMRLNPKYNFIEVIWGGKEKEIAIQTIMYIESKKNYLFFYTEGKILDGVIKTRKKISEAEKEWNQYGFIRVHKSFLVNIRFIQRMDEQMITLRDGTKITIGRIYFEKARDYLMGAKADDY